MKNPLIRRIPRAFRDELGKYIVIFLFMILVIGFVSGFLVASHSMIAAYNESLDKYNIEYGHFIAKDEPGSGAIDGIVEDGNVDIEEQFYMDLNIDSKSKLRVFKPRQNINKVCLMDGELPKNADEAAIDRMYAENNGYAIGDELSAGKRKIRIVGIVALSDYSALFSDNSDMMFDSVLFGVGIVTEDGFAEFEKASEKVHYQYAWDYHENPADKDAEIDAADDLIRVIVRYLSPETILPRYANQAINFTGTDLGGDTEMIKVLLYILILVLAFVFSITIRHTITREASVIGTLRASGYTKGELVRHYISLPVLVTIVSAIIGNILGYTVFKDIAAAMYYGSYSLTTFTVLWNAEAFILTTVVPVAIMLIINFFSVSHALKLSPLRFLRHDLTKNKRSKAVRLPRWKFFGRFRLRIIFQNKGNYIMMFVGIMLANVFLLFGMMMGPLLSHYQDEVLDTMPAKYQYILKTQIATSYPDAEKFCLSSLDYYYDEDGDSKEGFSIYGISDESKYVKVPIPTDGTVAIADGIYEKYGVDVGDDLVLHEEYGKKIYTFKVGQVVSYPSSLAVFMPRKMYNDTLKPEMGLTDVISDTEMFLQRIASVPEYEYYNAYFSNQELKDIDSRYIQSTITETDLTKVSRQLDVSMGELFQLWNVFSIVLFVLLIYLLTKLVLERNTTSISMVKILGYRDSEVARLYLMATTWIVILSIGISFLVATPVIIWLYHVFMIKMSGWLTIWINWDTYVKMFGLGVVAYGLVALLQYMRIRRIPMDEALKNVE